jgi:DNA polymerase-1
MRLVFDIETDALLRDATRMWCLVTYDLDTGTINHYEEGDLSWKLVFDSAELLVGHNIINFDLMVLKKLFGYNVKPSTKVQDTLLLSQILNYRRFPSARHGLADWGEHLGVPKFDFSDWSGFSKEMLEYCIQDVKVNVVVYKSLTQELNRKMQSRGPYLSQYIKAEHAAAMWAAEASLKGWPFDIEKAVVLYERLEKELEKAYATLQERLGWKAVAVDMVGGVVAVKAPKWTKAGCYNSHTAKWFDIEPWAGYEGEERPIEGEFCRVEFKRLSLDSSQDVKLFLYRQGWQPTEWNYKRTEDGAMTKLSPKITPDSLELLGGDGQLYTDFLTAKSRHAILKTWIENTDENGRLHGDCMLIGTPSMRARHSIIVNVPSGASVYGKEMRELFTCDPGYVLVGADSSGNQARGLAHYLKNDNFTHILLNEDIHTYNATILTGVLKDMGVDHEVPRNVAKRILYAFLFGASGAKLWGYIFGTQHKSKGKRLRDGFLQAVPGFSKLVATLEGAYGKTSNNRGVGRILSLAGNDIYVDSKHKLLVYLLQATEKITCSSAIEYMMEQFAKEGIEYSPLIYYHDEADFQVREDQAERAAEIAAKAFAEGPKLFGVTIMAGEAKIGKNWYEIH